MSEEEKSEPQRLLTVEYKLVDQVTKPNEKSIGFVNFENTTQDVHFYINCEYSSMGNKKQIKDDIDVEPAEKELITFSAESGKKPKITTGNTIILYTIAV